MPKALIVDEYYSFRVLLTEILEEAGFSVIQENDAHHAIELARFTHPDVVVTELSFEHSEHPNVDGFKLLQALRDAGLKVPIIVISSETFEHGVENLKQKGFFEALPKPLQHIDQIMVTVNHAMQVS